MTLSTSIASQTFPGNGLAQIFPCAFRIFDETDVVVSLVDPGTGTSTGLVLNTDYTIAGAGDATGFTLSTLFPVEDGKNLLVARVMPYTQPTDFTNQGSFFPTMHEDAMDRLGMQIQQLAGTSGRSVRVPDGLIPSPSTELPIPLPLHAIGWNESGDALQNISLPDAGSGIYDPAVIVGTTRLIADRLREHVSLFDAGAVGDGSDESVKIQAALDSGRDVFVPNGTFTATGLTLSTSGARIYGPGTIKKKAGVDGVLLTISADDCIVDGVHFDGTATQPTQNFTNNIVNVVGNRNKVLNCTINGSAGGGINIPTGCCYNVLAFNTILDSHDNNIIAGGDGVNDNLILGNYCDGTAVQNNIFITADPGNNGAQTTKYNYRNRIIGNTCLNAGDTGIEAGVHSVGCIIQGNTVKNSKNPEILTRDSIGCVIVGNHVEAGADASATHDGIALVAQSETNWRYGAIISSNRVTGNLTRAGILNQSAWDVRIEGNSIEETFATVNSATGSGLTGSGIAVATSADDIVIRNNSVRRMSYGVNMNYASGTPSFNRLTIEGNRIYDVSRGINIFQVTTTDTSICGNFIGKVVLLGFETITANGSYSTIMARNRIDMAGYSSASPTSYSNGNLISLSIFTAENVNRQVVPETQFGTATIAAASRRSGGYLAIEFEDGSEDAVFGVSKTATGKIVGTSNLVDSTGASGSTGWTLTYDGSSNLILQRRAASTGAGARYFRYRFTKTANEI